MITKGDPDPESPYKFQTVHCKSGGSTVMLSDKKKIYTVEY